MTEFIAPPAPGQLEPPALDPISLILSDGLRDAIWTAAASSPRSTQVTAGASEIGSPGARQTAYRSLGIPAVHFPDPWRAIVGSGIHLAMADYFRRLDGGSGRYLVEHPITYLGVPGTVDLLDRRRHVLVDWKFPRARRISDVRRDGPSRAYLVQLNIYAAGLREQGEQVDRIALAFIPADGDLDGIHVWHGIPDLDLATSAIRASNDNAELARAAGPSAVPATPSRLCPWCAHYRPGSTDLDIACPSDSLTREIPK
jgi:hypothetical protein